MERCEYTYRYHTIHLRYVVITGTTTGWLIVHTWLFTGIRFTFTIGLPIVNRVVFWQFCTDTLPLLWLLICHSYHYDYICGVLELHDWFITGLCERFNTFVLPALRTLFYIVHLRWFCDSVLMGICILFDCVLTDCSSPLPPTTAWFTGLRLVVGVGVHSEVDIVDDAFRPRSITLFWYYVALYYVVLLLWWIILFDSSGGTVVLPGTVLYSVTWRCSIPIIRALLSRLFYILLIPSRWWRYHVGICYSAGNKFVVNTYDYSPRATVVWVLMRPLPISLLLLISYSLLVMIVSWLLFHYWWLTVDYGIPLLFWTVAVICCCCSVVIFPVTEYWTLILLIVCSAVCSSISVLVIFVVGVVVVIVRYVVLVGPFDYCIVLRYQWWWVLSDLFRYSWAFPTIHYIVLITVIFVLEFLWYDTFVVILHYRYLLFIPDCRPAVTVILHGDLEYSGLIPTILLITVLRCYGGPICCRYCAGRLYSDVLPRCWVLRALPPLYHFFSLDIPVRLFCSAGDCTVAVQFVYCWFVPLLPHCWNLLYIWPVILGCFACMPGYIWGTFVPLPWPLYSSILTLPGGHYYRWRYITTIILPVWLIR